MRIILNLGRYVTKQIVHRIGSDTNTIHDLYKRLVLPLYYWFKSYQNFEMHHTNTCPACAHLLEDNVERVHDDILGSLISLLRVGKAKTAPMSLKKCCWMTSETE